MACLMHEIWLPTQTYSLRLLTLVRWWRSNMWNCPTSSFKCFQKHSHLFQLILSGLYELLTCFPKRLWLQPIRCIRAFKCSPPILSWNAIVSWSDLRERCSICQSKFMLQGFMLEVCPPIRGLCWIHCSSKWHSLRFWFWDDILATWHTCLTRISAEKCLGYEERNQVIMYTPCEKHIRNLKNVWLRKITEL